jgi:hypothetical protein
VVNLKPAKSLGLEIPQAVVCDNLKAGVAAA